MEVILVQPVKNLGKLGQVVNVKDGFGRNFLIPQGLAIRATESNKKQFDDMKAEIEKRNSETKFQAGQISTKLNGQIFTIIKQAGDDGRLFGSVNAKELAKIISQKFDGVKHSNILLKDAIKSLGLYEVEILLHPEVQTIVHINIARTETEAQDALRNFASKNEKSEDTASAA